jgi:catechol 2,3-dioxygenase-like lactoylglutathione lyase family enzyme
MLGEYELIVFAQTTHPELAKSFYADVLGLKFQGEDPFAFSFLAERTLIRIQKMRAEYSPLPWTRFGWSVPDIAAAVKNLTDKGVAFERMKGVPQDDAGIWTTPDGTKVCWFKDPDGNVLSLTQFSPA